MILPVNEDKEVDFEKYCPMCSNFYLDGAEEPCNECLDCPTRYASHVPINYDGEILAQEDISDGQTV